MHPAINTPKYVIKLAQEMRRNMTKTEEILWEKLRNKQLGVKFRAQHPLNRYILDFYCHEQSLGIEIDGEIHKYRIDEDALKDLFFQDAGIKIMRIKTSDLLKDLDKVIEKIKVAIFNTPFGGKGEFKSHFNKVELLLF